MAESSLRIQRTLLPPTMGTRRFRPARLRRALIFGVVLFSLVMQPRTMRPYLQEAFHLQSVTTLSNESGNCRPPLAQGLVDWINDEGNITKKKQLKLLRNIPSIYRVPVEYDIDLLSKNEDDDEYAALSFHDYQFTLVSNHNSSSVRLSDFIMDQSWDEVQSSLFLSQDAAIALDAVYCRIPKHQIWFLDHFPHFVQRFFPCWSILHALMEESIVSSSANPTKSRNLTLGTQLYIVLPELYQVRRGSYIESLLQHIASRDTAGASLSPSISIVYGNATLSSEIEVNSRSLLIECSHSEGGWGAPVKYFMAPKRANMQSLFYGVPQLQRLVLGDDALLKLDAQTSTSFLQVLILDRVGSTRTIAFLSEMRMLLGKSNFTVLPNACGDTARRVRMFHQNDPSNAQVIHLNVTYIPSFTGWTVQDQARAMQRADVILSPHGAQLTNAIFIRPCTVVLELYPYAYYVPFFPSLVRSAVGTPWVAYPQCYDRYADRNRTMQDVSYRGKVRSVPLFISPHSIARNLLPMVRSYFQCRCERQKG